MYIKNKILIVFIISMICSLGVSAQKKSIFFITDSTKYGVRMVFEDNDSIPYKDYHFIGERGNLERKLYLDKKSNILLLEERFIGDSVYVYQYYEDGNIQYLTVLYNQVLISEKAWCRNGNLLRFSKLTSFPAHMTNYYCNGQKRNEFTLNKVIAVGPYFEWYENGNKMKEGNYDDRGQETGHWKYYSEEGKLIKEEEWKAGKLLSTKEY